jgi:hypothetical protein
MGSLGGISISVPAHCARLRPRPLTAMGNANGLRGPATLPHQEVEGVVGGQAVTTYSARNPWPGQFPPWGNREEHFGQWFSISSARNAILRDGEDSAVDAELQTYGLVQQEKVNWFDSYKLNHRTLSQMFYKEAKMADTYFKAMAKAKKKGEGEGTKG